MMRPVPRFDSYSAGAYSRTVCVYRRKPGGPYHCEIGTERRAIRPRIYDDRAARRWAHRAAEDLEDGLDALAAGTGRRLGAILALRYSDLRLDTGSFGSIRWRSAHDKIKREAVVPIGPDVRRALDLALSRRPGIGEGWLFPAPRKRGAHVSRSVADSWLREAERAAGLTHLPGTLWHAYRRGWATARKHLPGADVAHAGGWANARTLQTVYQQPDAETLERVVLEAVELREKR